MFKKFLTKLREWIRKEIEISESKTKDNFDQLDNWSTDDNAPYYTDGQ